MLPFEPTGQRMVLRYHPVLGHLYVPCLNARVPHEGGGYFVRTTGQGFRSDAEFVKPRGERPRILFFGDSYTAGDGCDNHERFSERVGAALEAEVYNFGLSGSGTDQQLLVLEHLARGIEADLIVWCVAVHNIERIKVGHRLYVDRETGRRVLGPKPWFTLEADGLCLHQVPVPRHRPPLEKGEVDRFEAPIDHGGLKSWRLVDRVRRSPPGWVSEGRSR